MKATIILMTAIIFMALPVGIKASRNRDASIQKFSSWLTNGLTRMSTNLFIQRNLGVGFCTVVSDDVRPFAIPVCPQGNVSQLGGRKALSILNMGGSLIEQIGLEHILTKLSDCLNQNQ